MIAADIMRKHVITIRDTDTLQELTRLLLDNKITGAPVLDKDGRLVGVVSQTDLVRRSREDGEPRQPAAFHRGETDQWLGSKGFEVETPEYARVRDVMTPAVPSADASTPVEELARCMAAKHIHRLVITRGGKLAGIVTSIDIMRAVAARSSRRAKAKAA
jgi:CBS domain-containing protein